MMSFLLISRYHSHSLQIKDKAVIPKTLDDFSFEKLNVTDLTKIHQQKINKETCFTRKWLRKIESIKKDEVCSPRHILVNYCYGTCNSVYIPHTISQAFSQCNACTSGKESLQEKVVFLKCQKQRKDGSLGQKTVQLVIVKHIRSCGCRTIECRL